MIAYNVSVGSLRVEDMDSDGFIVRDTENHAVWMSHGQLDDLARLSELVRKVNGEPS